MNIVVCLKAVPTNAGNPVARNDGAGILAEGAVFTNESDDYALEQALHLKKSFGAKVTAVTVGPVKSEEILRVSLAKGADEAIRVDGEEFDPNIVSFILSRAIRTLSYDLILTGMESSDRMTSQVGVSLGAQLGVPYVYAVTNVAIENAGSPLLVTRELGEGRFQTLEVDKPALLCVQSGIVALTYTPLVKLIHARRRAIPCLSSSGLGTTDQELAQRRKAKVIDIKPVEKSRSTQWLSGTPQELALQIIDKIRKAV